MSKEYYRNLIATRRKEIITLRKKITDIKEDKKKKNAYYADQIKRASSASSKASLRKSKVDYSNSYDKQIDSIKSKIEYIQKEISRYKDSLKRA